MGTTMHAHIEVKKNGTWLHYACPNVTRNYLFFAFVNGTRKEDFENQPDVYNKINPVCRINKIPDDISEVTSICLDMDAEVYRIKRFGVLEGSDLETLQHRLWKFNDSIDPEWDLEDGLFNTYIGGNSIAGHNGFDDVRVIFWFDN